MALWPDGLASDFMLVEKDTHDGVASTTLATLEGEDRVREIARMLGGDPDSPSSLEHRSFVVNTKQLTKLIKSK